MKNLTLTQAILNFSFSTDSGTPTEHLQLVSSKNIHWFRFYDFFSVKFCVDFFLTVSYLTNYPTVSCEPAVCLRPVFCWVRHRLKRHQPWRPTKKARW